MKTYYHILLIFLILLFPALTNADAVKKLPPEKLKAYYESGQYYKDMGRNLNDAKEYLDRQLQSERINPLAIVLDIDETTLSNYQDLERFGFNHNTQALTAAFMLGQSTAIEPVLNLYEYAIQQGVHVFFISERLNTPEIMSKTVQNLKQAGYTKWENLILKPLDSKQTDQEFKIATRRHIASQDYDIIMNVGDQDSDLKGGYAEIKVKIPNPFYELG
jgi:predicted secreted acid phosphatase